MQVTIHRQQLELPSEARDTLIRRLEFALDRFAGHVRTVAAFVGDVNGPRGGIDKRCRLVAQVAGAGVITVESRGSHFGALFTAAASKLAGVVRRHLERRRSRRSASSAESGQPHVASRFHEEN